MKELILLPNLLSDQGELHLGNIVIDALIAESYKGGYAYLKRFSLPKVPVYLLSEHTQEVGDLLKIQEARVGLISDAGLPCLADPGAAVVFLARKRGIPIRIGAAGPSSLLYSLMLSGFPAQSFFFHGYPPRKEKELEGLIRGLSRPMTHLFIETPYRNHSFFSALLKNLRPQDLICVGVDLTSSTETVIWGSVLEVKKKNFLLEKKPAFFVLYIRPLA